MLFVRPESREMGVTVLEEFTYWTLEIPYKNYVTTTEHTSPTDRGINIHYND